jgi:hypothetical protein
MTRPTNRRAFLSNLLSTAAAVALALMFSGCSYNWNIPGGSVPIVEQTSTPGLQAIITLSSQVEAQPETSTPSPQVETQPVSPTMSLTVNESHQCSVINEILPAGFLSPGKIVYRPENFDPLRADSHTPGLMVVDPLTNMAYPFPEATECCSYILESERLVSRDRKWVALEYENFDKKQFGYLITNANNSSTYSFMKDSVQNPWQYLLTWLNDERMVLYPQSNTPQYPNRFLVYHPLTNQKTEVELSLPGLLPAKKEYPVLDWYNAIYPSFDPTMTRAVYYKWDDTDTLYREIVLWDMEANIPLWRFPLESPLYEFEVSEPKWATDGSWFVTVLRDQKSLNQVHLMRIFRDGRQEILRTGILGESLSAIAGVSISPNQRYISFFVYEDGNHHLYILDLDRDEVWDTCMAGPVASNAPVSTHTEGVWSPDSRQIIVSTNIDISSIKTINGETRFIVDIEKKEIIRFDIISSRWVIWLAP